MRIYSDTLDVSALHAPTHGHPFYLYDVRELPSPRLASRGWELRLGSTVSNRHRNSGRYGAMTWASHAPASWDDHGRYLAAIFDADPDARVRAAMPYNGRDDFHAQTGGKYLRCSECGGPVNPCEGCPHGEEDSLCANPDSDHYGEHVLAV